MVDVVDMLDADAGQVNLKRVLRDYDKLLEAHNALVDHHTLHLLKSLTLKPTGRYTRTRRRKELCE